MTPMTPKTAMTPMIPMTNLLEVKDALNRAASRNAEIVPVFKLLIAMRVVRAELFSTPSRGVAVFLISAIDVIWDLCVHGKHNHPELSLGDPKLIRHLALFTVYRMLGVSAVKTALTEESCDVFHEEVIARLSSAPKLDAFEVSGDEGDVFEACAAARMSVYR